MGTLALVLCYLALLTSFMVSWTTMEANGDESVGGYGALLGYGSLSLGLLLTAVLLVVYVVLVFSRDDWSWSRRSAWAASFWAAAPLTMPVYFVRHMLRRNVE
jgi:uncharacterized membrane protein